MKRVWQIIGILVGLLLVVGAAIYALTPREKLLASIAPEIENIRVTDIHISEQNATMLVHFETISKIIPVFITSLAYDFRLYGKSIAQGNQKFKAASKNGKRQHITLPLRLNYLDNIALIRRQVTEGTALEARLQAIGTLPFNHSQNFTLNKKLPFTLPLLPAPAITHVATQDFGFQHQRLILTVAIDNPNNYDFYLRDLKMNVQLKDYLASAGSLRKDYLLKARRITSVEIPSTSAIKRPQPSPKSSADQPALPYTMQTSLVLEPISEVMGKIYLEASRTGTIHIDNL